MTSLIVMNPEQLQRYLFLQQNPYFVAWSEPTATDEYLHYYTVGLSRFGWPELYTRHSVREMCSINLPVLADAHMEQLLPQGVFDLPDICDQSGWPISLTGEYLSGSKLYEAAERISCSSQILTGMPLDEAFSTGVCQILWPDSDNMPIGAFTYQFQEMKAQLITGAIVH